ncbi:MAG: serine/threonine-protein kinase [Pirellulales bacterium]
MPSPLESTHKYEAEPGTVAWERLSTQVDALSRAWEGHDLPPDLQSFVPPAKEALRRLMLVELVKVDLEQRWLHHGLPKRLEEYIDEFPELGADGGVPCDLIYEEFHIRSQTDEPPSVDEFFERFPTYSEQLKRLLDMQTNKTTSTAISGRRGPEIEVGQQIDDFDLLTRLGKGAFASVYLARQRSMQRLVALKVSTDRGDEPQTLAQLDHPHIVRVYDQRLLPERRLRLLYMQLVAGGTLHGVADLVRLTAPALRTGKMLLDCVDSALEDRGESPPSESALRRRLARTKWPGAVCWLGGRVAAALDYAHQRGILHRDVKPANVLLTAEGSPKLADFNVSFSSKLDGATPAAYFGGSLAYMSPEQLEAANPTHPREPKELDGRSDIFSLGVMLWELLTGERPFGDEHFTGSWNATLDALIQRRREGLPAEMLTKLPRDMPLGMREVLLSCLAADPNDRPATAAELARQLDLCLQPRAQRLMRPSRATLESWARRWPLMAIVAVGVLANGVFSLLNIYFNVQAVFEKEQILRDNIYEMFWNRMMPVVNGSAYPVGIALGLFLCWPVVRAVRQRANGLRSAAAANGEALAAARVRSLWIADYLSWMTIGLWSVSGVIFAWWISIEVQALGKQVPRNLYAHFIPSQVFWGLITSLQVFFLTNVLALRAFLPALLDLGRNAGDDVSRLLALQQRSGWYFAVAISTPFVALLMLATDSDYWPQVGTIAGVGFACSMGALYLNRLIRRDLEALATALEPGRETLAGGGETSESFWTSSR